MVVHGGRRIPRLPSLRPAAGPWRRGGLRRRLLDRAPVQRGPPGRRRRLRALSRPTCRRRSRSTVRSTGVFNLASPASPPDYLALPLETLAVGSEGTRRGLELAHVAGARFLMASTSEVYGDPEVHPQPESYWGNVNPVGPRSVYDEAKRFAEALGMAHHRTQGTDVGIARIFNTYGPRLRPDDGRVVSNFLAPGHAGRAPHRLRRRQPDPEPLLRRGRGTGAHRPVRLRPRGPGQHRQPRRVHRPRVGQDGDRRSSGSSRPSSTGRCRSTTPLAAGRTSRLARAAPRAGSRPPRSATGWPGPPPTWPRTLGVAVPAVGTAAEGDAP